MPSALCRVTSAIRPTRMHALDLGPSMAG
jgi:hypothetical protein